MATKVRCCNYYYVTVVDHPGEGFRLLTRLSELGVNLRAFTGMPVGPMRTQFSLFPEDEAAFCKAADKMRLTRDGPHTALLAQGTDEMGVLAELHHRLFDANVNVYASNGVSDGKGDYGYVIHVRPDQIDAAAKALDALVEAPA